MSFFNISDPNKRDLIVKEYLELKKNIRNNLLSERTAEQQLQTDLSKFYKPIKEGIENLPQAIQPLGEALGEAASKEALENLGKKVYNYLKDPEHDKTFGIRKEKGLYHIGNNQVTITDNNIMIDNEIFQGTPGL